MIDVKYYDSVVTFIFYSDTLNLLFALVNSLFHGYRKLRLLKKLPFSSS